MLNSSASLPMYKVVSSPMLLYRLRCLFPSSGMVTRECGVLACGTSAHTARQRLGSTRVPSWSAGTHPWRRTKQPHRTCWDWLSCYAATAVPTHMMAQWLDTSHDKASYKDSPLSGRPIYANDGLLPISEVIQIACQIPAIPQCGKTSFWVMIRGCF